MATIKQATAADHADLVHDLSYDYYGDRMATCSSDQHVKVWEKDENGQWVNKDTWKAHSASVWRVTWAHPEFGSIIATCSFDRTAAIWEELVSVSGSGGTHSQTKSWARKHVFVDSKTCVSDVKFAPKHLGLQLATCSNDGTVRIYEAPDVMNLSTWTLQLEIPVKLSLSSVSWCSSIRLNPIIAVGCDDPNTSNGSKVFIYELTDGMRRSTRIESVNIADSVQDVAFAPNLGRSLNLLAIAAKDVTIIQLKTVNKDRVTSGQTKFEQRQVAQFNDHKSTVWRLCWNITGTTLASTGDDGCIRLWKSNYLGTWASCGVLKGDGSLIEREQKAQHTSASGLSSTGHSFRPDDARFAQTKRNSGWPYFTTQKDSSRAFY